MLRQRWLQVAGREQFAKDQELEGDVILIEGENYSWGYQVDYFDENVNWYLQWYRKLRAQKSSRTIHDNQLQYIHYTVY